MEYCEGGELYSNCNLHRLSTEKQIAEVVLIITDALDFCHSKGIVHRDIKVQINLFSLKISSGRPKTKRQSWRSLILDLPSFQMSNLWLPPVGHLCSFRLRFCWGSPMIMLSITGLWVLSLIFCMNETIKIEWEATVRVKRWEVTFLKNKTSKDLVSWKAVEVHLLLRQRLNSQIAR